METVDRSVMKEFVYFLLFLLFIAVVYFVLSGFMEKTYAVEGQSMYPTLHPDDLLYTDKRSFNQNEILRGDIVVIKLETGFNVVKRVIAVAGDSVKIENGKLYVNNVQQNELYINKFEEGLVPADLYENIVPEGYVFVLGDNRLHSSDSREFGFVNVDIIKAKVKSIVWPLERKGANLHIN